MFQTDNFFRCEFTLFIQNAIRIFDEWQHRLTIIITSLLNLT
jgi:hypothetical protein